MTREEARKRLMGILAEAVEFENSVCYVTEEDREPLEIAIKALEQEPTDDATLKDIFCMGCEYKEQEPKCRDCVSRDYLLSIANKDGAYGYVSAHEIINAPSVNPQPKTGRWILGICDNCRYDWGKDTPIASVPNFCPNCGRRMVEPQESEE